MIAALVHLMIVLLVCGLLFTILIWFIESVLQYPIPMIAKQVVGIILFLIVLLYVLSIIGVA